MRRSRTFGSRDDLRIRGRPKPQNDDAIHARPHPGLDADWVCDTPRASVCHSSDASPSPAKGRILRDGSRRGDNMRHADGAARCRIDGRDVTGD